MAGDAVVGSYAGTGKDAAVLIGLPITVDDVDAQIDAIFDGAPQHGPLRDRRPEAGRHRRLPSAPTPPCWAARI